VYGVGLGGWLTGWAAKILPRITNARRSCVFPGSGRVPGLAAGSHVSVVPRWLNKLAMEQQRSNKSP
jgi:hypothetical protein